MEDHKISEVNGDVTLEVSRTNAKVHLLVSSKVLALASSVFAAMLNSKFKADLSNDDGGLEKTPISLPEQGMDAFTVICNVIHYRVDEVPEDLPLSCLKNLLASIEFSAPEDFSKLLLAAYILDIPAMLSKISWEIIIRQAGSSVDLPELVDQDLFNDNVPAEFEAIKAAIHRMIFDAVESPLVDIIGESHCISILQMPGKYLLSLKSSGLWPTASILRTTSIFSALNRMMSLHEPEPADKCSAHWSASCPRNFNLGDIIREKREKILKAPIDVCLDCVRTNRKSLREKICRIKHPSVGHST